MNLHSGVALLNIATEDLLSAGAGVGEHCICSWGSSRNRGTNHKSKRWQWDYRLPEPCSCTQLNWATFLLGGVDGVSFMLSFSLPTWHFPSCAWRDFLRLVSVGMNMFW